MAADFDPDPIFDPHGSGVYRLAAAVELRRNVSEYAAATLPVDQEDNGILSAVSIQITVELRTLADSLFSGPGRIALDERLTLVQSLGQGDWLVIYAAVGGVHQRFRTDGVGSR